MIVVGIRPHHDLSVYKAGRRAGDGERLALMQAGFDTGKRSMGIQAAREPRPIHARFPAVLNERVAGIRARDAPLVLKLSRTPGINLTDRRKRKPISISGKARGHAQMQTSAN